MTAFATIAGNIIGAAFVGAILVASGARIRRVLRMPASPGIRWAVDLICGAGFCSFWVLGLGLAGLLEPAPLAIGLIIQGLFAQWRRVPRPGTGILVAAAAGLPNLLIAVGPPHFYDAMVYHLGLPWQALQEGRWAPHPENVFSAFPPLAQLVATPALAWGGFRVPAILHWLAWVCAAAAAGALARRMGVNKPGSLLLTAAAMLLPTTALIPGFPAAEGWFLAAIIPALACTVSSSPRRAALPLVVLLTGLAAATRIQGLTWVVIVVGVWFLRTRSLMPILRSAPWFVIGATPWWAKNLILLGDPAAPIFWHREGLDTLWRDGAALLKSGVSLLDIGLRLPVILAPVAPVVAPLMILAVLAAAAVQRSRAAFSAGLLGLLLWAGTGALPRFLTPTLILLMATILSWRRPHIARWVGAGCVTLVLAFGIAAQLRWMPLVHPTEILGLSYDEAAPFVAPSPPFSAYRDADGILPADARVLVVGDTRGFGLPRPFVVTSQHDPCVLRNMMEGENPPDLVARDLADTGISHLAVNTGEMQRLLRDYPVTPWRTTRGEGRWTEFLRSLGPPVLERDGVQLYDVTAIHTLPK